MSEGAPETTSAQIAELKRFLRDAGSTSFDTETLDISPESFFAADALQWYRSRFEANNPGKDSTVDDVTFLHNEGFLTESNGLLKPTRGGSTYFLG